MGRSQLMASAAVAAVAVAGYLYDRSPSGEPGGGWAESLGFRVENEHHPTASTSPVPQMETGRMRASTARSTAHDNIGPSPPHQPGSADLGVANYGNPPLAGAHVIRQADPDGWVTVGPVGLPTLSQQTSAGYAPPTAGMALAGNTVPQSVASPPSAVPANPGQNIAHWLQFAVSPTWVENNWPRVSTHILDKDLQGMRVALVSGVHLHDLAGSLTYYFDREQILQRIDFHGVTGDPRPLVSWVTQQFSLEQESMLAGALLLNPPSKTGKAPQSAVRIQRIPIVRAERPGQRYEVQLELNRPAGKYGLSSRFVALLEADRESHRWLPAGTRP